MSTGKKIAGYSVLEWKIAAGIAVLGLGMAIYFFATRESRESTPRKPSPEAMLAAARGSALLNCQRALKSASRDPATAQIPAVAPLQGGADWRFLWAPNTEMARMRNGLGLEVAVGAFCVVDEASGKIKLLTLDGKQIIAPN